MRSSLSGLLLFAILTAITIASPRHAFDLHIPALEAEVLEPTGASVPDANAPLTTTMFLPLVTKPLYVFLPLIQQPPVVREPVPGDGATGQSLNTFLAWTESESFILPAPHYYDIYLDAGHRAPVTLLATGLTRPNYDPFTLAGDTLYSWKVDVIGVDGRRVSGPVWTFRTEPILTQPELDARIFVPAGWFTMGCDRANPYEIPCRDDVFHGEEPLHDIYLDAYFIDKYEVTNGEYRACVDAGACQPPRRTNSHKRNNYYGNPAYDDYPVLYVSNWDAQAFCAWDGGRLPTEAEWEQAARGPYDRRVWPWGNEPPDCTRLNYTYDLRQDDWEVCVGDTTRVGSYPTGASPYGVMDMSGNVFEWVADKYDVFYYLNSPSVNPSGPEESRILRSKPPFGIFFTIRGGSYRPQWIYARVAHRHFGHHGDNSEMVDEPYYRNDQVGFRCASTQP